MYLFYPLCQIERLLWNNLHPKGSLVDSSMQTYMIIESFNKNGNNITEVDQWGTPLIIQKNTGGSCIISSNGPDKMPNTKDDIIVRFEGDGK